MDHTWSFSARWVDTEVDRARWRFTANARVLETLSLGVEVNPGEEEIGPLATWFVLREGEVRPGVFIGTSSDRIGTDAGDQSYYLTTAKALATVPVSAYVTLNYSEADEGLNVPFGATWHLPLGFGARGMYDGERTHLLGTYARERWSASVMWIWLERAGLSVSFGF